MSNENKTEINSQEHKSLLTILYEKNNPTPDEFRELVSSIDSSTILAKVFLLEGVPFVFQNNRMRYIIFKEQVADRFGVGSQDVCIIGSAKLGFSPSPRKYGKTFQEKSDVDVVIISEHWFHLGSNALFSELNTSKHKLRIGTDQHRTNLKNVELTVNAGHIVTIQDAIRNFVNNNFNPSLLSDSNPLKKEIFEKIASTAGLFLALEPSVFVSKIRCRFFRYWKAAEGYYANTLKVLSKEFNKKKNPATSDDADDGEQDEE